jgi:hypothetical protein
MDFLFGINMLKAAERLVAHEGPTISGPAFAAQPTPTLSMSHPAATLLSLHSVVEAIGAPGHKGEIAGAVEIKVAGGKPVGAYHGASLPG